MTYSEFQSWYSCLADFRGVSRRESVMADITKPIRKYAANTHVKNIRCVF